MLMVEQGLKNCDIQRATGIPESTLRNFKKRKDKLKWSIALARGFRNGRISAIPSLDESSLNGMSDKWRLIAITEQRLLNWAYHRLKERDNIDGPVLQKQACVIYQALCKEAAIKNPPVFQASKEWLERFKKQCDMRVSLADPQDDNPTHVLTIR